MRAALPCCLLLSCSASPPPARAPDESTPTRPAPPKAAPVAAPADAVVEHVLSPSLPLPSGIAFGEVTAKDARVWSRCDRDATLHVRLQHGDAGKHAETNVEASHDFAAVLDFADLEPNTAYDASAWCTQHGDKDDEPRPGAATGRFTTAPPNDAPLALRFAWSGDLGGQNVCRDASEGYPIFRPLLAGHYAFFIALGDMIYADTPCAVVGAWGNAQIERPISMATTVGEYQAHWRYNREDAAYQAFLAQTPYFDVWDDHEVVNDFGPKTDLRARPPYHAGEHLMPAAFQAMQDYNPLPADGKLTRRRRWGKHAELFFLDTRSFRDPNTQRDTDRAPKHMLGEEQVAWLLDALSSSDATWKFVISSVPLSIPTGLDGNSRDGFANYGGPTGFEHELLALLRAMRDRGLTDTVWLTTDVHFAAAFDYVPFPESPGFVVHEFSAGPLNAGFFPRDTYDKTLHPTRYYTWAVDNVKGVKDYAGAKALWNFGEVRISSEGALHVDIINALGERVRGRDVPAAY